MQDQIHGQQCASHEGQHGSCAISQVDYLVMGTPCQPFSCQRVKRFAPGAVAVHSLVSCTFRDSYELLEAFEPPTATMEQVLGFKRPMEKGSDETPFDRPGEQMQFEGTCF